MKAQLRQVRRIGIAVAVAALLATSAGCSLARTTAPDTVSESGGAVIRRPERGRSPRSERRRAADDRTTGIQDPWQRSL